MPRSGALARRSSILERAWIRVACEAVGPEGRVVPQQPLAATHAPVPAGDLRRLDLVVHGATPHGEALRRRWWSLLGVAVQRAVASTALGGEWQPAAGEDAPPLAAILALTPSSAPSRMPMRMPGSF